MSKMTSGFKMAALAASIALAMGSTAAMAATPATTQLPGVGAVKAGSATAGAIASGAQTITITGNTVINWGAAGGTINATQPGGFNIGSGASLTFSGAATTDHVLNVDVSGNPSQIFGTLKMSATGGNLYVANTNGVIVGATGKVSGPGEIGFIANTRGTVSFDGTAGDTSIEYQGAGSDVSIAKGAALNGATVLVSGGSNVNVDLSAFKSGDATIQAGFKNSSSTLVNDNTGAVLTAAGALGGGALVAFHSAGNASTSGTLTLDANAVVDGTLTNTGTLTLDTGFDIAGGLVNSKTVDQVANASMGSLVNSGAYTGGGFDLTTTDGGITNNASMTGVDYVEINGGDFINNGQFVSSNNVDTYGGGNIVNKGQATVGGYIDIYEGGNFVNEGTMTVNDSIYVVNGSITNSGKLSVDWYLETASDLSSGAGFTSGADYSITNTGTITATGGDLVLSANAENWSDYDSSSSNNSTGSVNNTGVLQLDAGGYLDLYAHNDVNLAGTVQAHNGTKYAALSAANALSGFEVAAGGYDGSSLSTDGVATLTTDIVTDGGAEIAGNQVKLMANLSSVDSAGDATDTIEIVAGDKQAADYAVRVAAGKTVLADTVEIDGDGAGNPNVILQGTISGNEIRFGYNGDGISDLFSGPTGSIEVTGSSPHVHLYFTGVVKAAPYLNNPGNFRYNYLTINVPDDQLYLELDPVAYTTNGTSNGKSAVNLLVNGDVNLDSAVSSLVGAGGSAVTGLTNIPNTHLVLQATGNIEVGDGGDFYWPGYVYLGNIATDGSGNPLPGTLGLGTITTDGDFNNVLPGDVAGASGIHFITQFPMSLGGDVVTNANAWVNFGTELIKTKYANEQSTLGRFYGGSQGAGTVINYDELDESSFNTAPPSSTR